MDDPPGTTHDGADEPLVLGRTTPQQGRPSYVSVFFNSIRDPGDARRTEDGVVRLLAARGEAWSVAFVEETDAHSYLCVALRCPDGSGRAVLVGAPRTTASVVEHVRLDLERFDQHRAGQLVGRAPRHKLATSILCRQRGQEAWCEYPVLEVSETGMQVTAPGVRQGMVLEVLLAPSLEASLGVDARVVCKGTVVRVDARDRVAVRFEAMRLQLNHLSAETVGKTNDGSTVPR